MPYNNAIPAATDRISASQPQILANFQAIQIALGANHVTFNGLAANIGKHNAVTFPVQAAIPASVVGEFVIYNKVPAAPYPLSGLSELFIKRNGGVSPYTAPLSMKTFTAGANSYCYLACGLLMKFGTGLTNDVGYQLIDLNTIAQNYTAVPFIFLTPKEYQPGNNYRAVQLRASDINQFEVDTLNFLGVGAVANYNWIAIGTY